MKTLGISAFYHDSAAALVVDSKIIAAAQEERFTRIKHDESFPKNAIEFCLQEGDCLLDEIDQIIFYEKPFLKFDRLLETYLSFAPSGLHSFIKAMPQWLKQKLHLPREIKKGLPGKWHKPIVFTTHHESHAASAFFPSPFDEAAILTMDGVGEWDTATIGIGEGNSIKLLKSLEFPHSLGLLYSAFTYFCGFKVNSGEYKLMGLAPYGKPIYKNAILKHLIDIKEDGSFEINLQYFSYCQGLTMTNKQFEKLFGGPSRKPENQITEREVDLAASIQEVTEEIVIRMATFARKLTGKNKLCLAGGVALNCVANGKLLSEKIFDELWIQPASGDAGGALGAALFANYQLLNLPRSVEPNDSMQGSYLGPNFSNSEITSFLKEKDAPFHYFDEESQLLDTTCLAIEEEKIIGWFQGKMEFGPRSLGHRSIIGDARSEKTQTNMNLRIKYRESFRPFAPSVLEEKTQKYFQLDSPSPYMLLVAPIQKGIRITPSTKDKEHMSDPNLLNRVKIKRSSLPSITHVDYSARVQSVSPNRNDIYYRLIKRLEEKTGTGVVVNTSFNVRGEPIVNTPEDAYRCFMATEMDILVLENHLLYKSEQPSKNLVSKDSHIATFDLD
ncbi:MAG: carbamoyltransferase [Opitutae bacterium]|nr:carbamoyltransferase [Opitutae bacterium]